LLNDIVDFVFLCGPVAATDTDDVVFPVPRFIVNATPLLTDVPFTLTVAGLLALSVIVHVPVNLHEFITPPAGTVGRDQDIVPDLLFFPVTLILEGLQLALLVIVLIFFSPFDIFKVGVQRLFEHLLLLNCFLLKIILNYI
jgi:hypothetical protein